METVAKRRYDSDDSFREVADLLFGGASDQLVAQVIAKSAKTDQEKMHRRQAQVGLATNTIGIGAALGATKTAMGDFKNPKPLASAARFTRVIPAALRKPKVLAGAALGLQGANLGGDLIANRVLARSAKNKDKVKKSNPDGADLHVNGAPQTRRGRLIRVVGRQVEPRVKQKAKQGYSIARGKLSKQLIPLTQDELVAKTATQPDILWEGEFSKFNDEKQQVFGWASIVKKDGQDVVDLQGDYISIDEIEKSAYDYVVKSRKGGNQHQRAGEEPLHVADMIESFIVTPEKVEKMGLPQSTPLGWWVGYQINDPATWDQVKSGERTGFSIHGRGQRSPM